MRLKRRAVQMWGGVLLLAAGAYGCAATDDPTGPAVATAIAVNAGNAQTAVAGAAVSVARR